MTSSNVTTWFQIMSFSWIPMVMSLSCIISIVTISQAVFGIWRLMCIWDKVSRMDQVKSVEDNFLKTWKSMVWFRLSSTNFTWSILEYFVPYVLLALIFSRQSERRKTVLFYPYISLINQVLVIPSFTTLHSTVMFHASHFRLGRVSWIIATQNRLVHWKVRFQSLMEYRNGAMCQSRLTQHNSKSKCK